MILQVLRVVHIVSGVIWVGGIFFLGLFLMPSVRAIGPAAGPVMMQLTTVRQFPKWMIIAGFLTISAGLWLFMHAASGAPGWMASGPAKTYGAGAVCAIVGWLIGMTLSAPLAKRLGAVNARIAASGVPPTAAEQAQIGAMGARLGMLSVIVMVLLLGATVAMALARYVS